MSSDVDYSDRQHVILVSVSCYIHYVSVDERVKATLARSYVLFHPSVERHAHLPGTGVDLQIVDSGDRSPGQTLGGAFAWETSL